MPMAPVTNQWFSSLFADPPQPLFVLPLAVRVEAEIEVGLPEVKATPKTIFASFKKDLSVALASPITECRVVAHGPGHVKIALRCREGAALLTLARGCPVAWVSCEKLMTLRVSGGSAQRAASSFLISADRRRFVLKDVSVSGRPLPALEQNPEHWNIGNDRALAICALPEKGDLPVELIPGPVLSSQYSWTQLRDATKTTLNFKFPGLPGQGICGWLPHHWDTAAPEAALGSYATLRGELRLARGNEIHALHPAPSLVAITDMLRALEEDQRKELAVRIENDAREILQRTIPTPVYETGKYLLKLAQLSEMASALKHALSKALAARLEDALALHLGLAPSATGARFRETSSPRGIVAMEPQYGNEEFNDHHFQYAYFLVAAAVALERNPNFLGKIAAGLEPLILDVGSENDRDGWPFARGFDPYESHSWASGKGNFFDGNNQESSSEAVLRWYGLLRLGRALKRQGLESLGLMGLAAEQDATRTYWLGHHPRRYRFPEGYEGGIAGIVWGGKVDFATWFSGEPTHIYGIQFLPANPSLAYSADPAGWKRFTLYKPQELPNGWNDIYYMAAAASGGKVPESLPAYEAGNSASFYYLWTRYFSKTGLRAGP